MRTPSCRLTSKPGRWIPSARLNPPKLHRWRPLPSLAASRHWTPASPRPSLTWTLPLRKVAGHPGLFRNSRAFCRKNGLPHETTEEQLGVENLPYFEVQCNKKWQHRMGLGMSKGTRGVFLATSQAPILVHPMSAGANSKEKVSMSTKTALELTSQATQRERQLANL